MFSIFLDILQKQAVPPIHPLHTMCMDRVLSMANISMLLSTNTMKNKYKINANCTDWWVKSWFNFGFDKRCNFITASIFSMTVSRWRLFPFGQPFKGWNIASLRFCYLATYMLYLLCRGIELVNIILYKCILNCCGGYSDVSTRQLTLNSSPAGLMYLLIQCAANLGIKMTVCVHYRPLDVGLDIQNWKKSWKLARRT